MSTYGGRVNVLVQILRQNLEISVELGGKLGVIVVGQISGIHLDVG